MSAPASVVAAGRRCMEENETFTHDVGGDTRGVRRSDLDLARLDAVLAAHDEALISGDDRVAKRGRKSSVTRHGDLVVKEHVPFGILGVVRDRLAPRRHSAGYRNAYRLLSAGVQTALPLAWLRRRGRVFTLYEDLSALTRLDLEARARYLHGDRDSQLELRRAVADWMGDLHARGIYHGDLKGSNVLVRVRAQAGEGLELPLIDTDRVRFLGRPLDPRRRVKNIAQLAASIAVVVTRSERLRWYRRYARTAHPSAGERATARNVAAALAPKTLVVDEPIE